MNTVETCPDSVPADDLVGTAGVLLTARDLGALDNLVHCGMSIDHPVRPLLAEKLERAQVTDAPPPDLATIESRLLFRIGPDLHEEDAVAQETRVLVLPSRYVANGLCLSLITPLGAALLGMRAGALADYTDRTGRRLRVVLDDVLFQPRHHPRPDGGR